MCSCCCTSDLVASTSRYWDAFLKQWDFIWKYQADHLHGGWHKAVSFEGKPNQPGQAKGTVWKAAYHDGRAPDERLRSGCGGWHIDAVP